MPNEKIRVLHLGRTGAFPKLWVMSPKNAMDGRSKGTLQTEDRKGDQPPKGAPTTYGPVVKQHDRELAVNPFWSERTKEKAQDEALLRSLRPEGFPESDQATNSRPATGGEDGQTGMPDMRQLIALVLQQNSQLKQEVDELKEKLISQSAVAPVMNRVERVEIEGQPKGQDGQTLSILDGPVVPLEDVKSEDVGLGAEWNTPPESVSAKRQSGLAETQPPGTVDLGAMTDQHQVLGQVTQTLSALVSQLIAATGAPATRCTGPGGEGRWSAMTGVSAAGALQMAVNNGTQVSRCMGLGGEGTWSAKTGVPTANGQGHGGGGFQPNVHG